MAAVGEWNGDFARASPSIGAAENIVFALAEVSETDRKAVGRRKTVFVAVQCVKINQQRGVALLVVAAPHPRFELCDRRGIEGAQVRNARLEHIGREPEREQGRKPKERRPVASEPDWLKS